VKLTERDALLLEAVNRFRIARTRDLLAVAFAGLHPMTASVRIRRLFDAGYLDVRCGDRTEENIYTLGSLGRRWAEGLGIQVGRVPRGGTAHHLAIVRGWSALAEAAQRRSGASVELTRPDWELREEFGEVGLPVVPDLFTVLAVATPTGNRSIALAVEVDLGTETLRVLEEKLAAYDLLAGREHGLFGHRDFGLAIVLANPGREVAVRRLIDRRWAGWWLLWSELDGPDAALAGVFDLLAGPIHPPVMDPRSGNGGPSALTSWASMLRPTLPEEH
jgi:hypothetical protein